MFTPALRFIKNQYPECNITFLTNAPNKPVLDKISYIDKVITIQRKKAFSRIRPVKELVNQDYVIFTDWQPQLSLLAFLLGIPVRACIPKPGHFFSRFLNKVLVNNVMHSTNYAAKTNALIFSEALGVQIVGDMTKPDISRPSETDVRIAVDLLQRSGLSADSVYICMAPFTGLEQRNWPLEYVQQFVSMVTTELRMPVLLIGPNDKRFEAESIKGAHNLVGTTSIMQMVEIISRAKLYVGPDSGPMHIAGAVGTPLVALFSKDLPSRWMPQRNCRPITLELPCSPCDDNTARRCESLQCMHGITPEMVFAVTRQELDRL